MYAPLGQQSPEKNLRLIQGRNPDLNLNRLPSLDPYRVALGVLKMFTEE